MKIHIPSLLISLTANIAAVVASAYILKSLEVDLAARGARIAYVAAFVLCTGLGYGLAKDLLFNGGATDQAKG